MSDKNKVQTGLEYIPSVTIITQRNRQYYQSCWMTVHVPYKQLYHDYIETCINYVSYGTFIALKPFYILGVTKADMEMCCCKKHLHARWVINAIIECGKKNNIPLPFGDYSSFFSNLSRNCVNAPTTTYLPWSCTPDSKTTCPEISSNWNHLKKNLAENSKADITVKFKYVDNELVTSKKTGKVRKCLKERCISVNMTYLVTFVSGILVDIIHHRNQLKHYRSSRPGRKRRANARARLRTRLNLFRCALIARLLFY